MAELTPLYMDINSVYSGDELGLPWRDIIGEGVVGTALGTVLKVTEKSGSPNLSVDIAAGAAWVLGDTNVDAQPIYRIRNDAVVNKGITPDPSNPRKAIVIAQITDESFAGTGRTWAIQVLHGTPAGSPLAPAVPASALLLATIDIPAADTAITNAQITDERTLAKVGSGQLGGGAGGASGAIAVDLRNPQVGANVGNCFPTVTALTAWEELHWEFVKDVAGKLYGIVKVPASGTTAAKIVLSILANATSGVTRLNVKWAGVADAASLNPASLTAITSQDITVPGTARLRKDVTFTLASQPAANDILIVEIEHEGAHANDTLAVNTELLGAWLLPS